MLKGLYSVASGMKARLAEQDVRANNLANAGTPGFQRELAFAVSRKSAPLVQPLSTRPRPAASIEALDVNSVVDRRPGQMQDTGSDTDVALEGSGYFVVRTPAGTRLSRGGVLRPNLQGELATLSGEPVLDTTGNPIRIGDNRYKVDERGQVSVDGAVLGRLRVVMPSAEVRHAGGGLLSSSAYRDAAADSYQVRQGTLEQSNVNPIEEMVAMITGQRGYEMAQKCAQSQDTTLEQLLGVLRR